MGEGNQCPRCYSRDTPDGGLCRSCTTRTRNHLSAIPTLLAHLRVAASRQTAYGDRHGSRDADTPLPVNLTAADTHRALETLLTHWGTSHPEPTDPAERARWLAGHATVWRTGPHIAMLAAELDQLVARCERVIDKPPELIPLGPCDTPRSDGDTCHYPLRVERAQAWVQCPSCRANHDITQRKARALAESAHIQAPAPRLARLISALGVPCTPAMIHRLGVASTYIDHTGARWYRLGDVMDAAARRDRERSEAVG